MTLGGIWVRTAARVTYKSCTSWLGKFHLPLVLNLTVYRERNIERPTKLSVINFPLLLKIFYSRLSTSYHTYSGCSPGMFQQGPDWDQRRSIWGPTIFSLPEDLTYLISRRPKTDTQRQITSGTPGPCRTQPRPNQYNTRSDRSIPSYGKAPDQHPQEEMDVREANPERKEEKCLEAQQKASSSSSSQQPTPAPAPTPKQEPPANLPFETDPYSSSPTPQPNCYGHANMPDSPSKVCQTLDDFSTCILHASLFNCLASRLCIAQTLFCDPNSCLTCLVLWSLFQPHAHCTIRPTCLSSASLLCHV